MSQEQRRERRTNALVWLWHRAKTRYEGETVAGEAGEASWARTRWHLGGHTRDCGLSKSKEKSWQVLSQGLTYDSLRAL